MVDESSAVAEYELCFVSSDGKIHISRVGKGHAVCHDVANGETVPGGPLEATCNRCRYVKGLPQYRQSRREGA